RVLSEVPRQRLDAPEEAREVAEPRVLGIEAGAGDLGFEPSCAVLIAPLAEAPRAELLRETVHLLLREAEHLRALAHGRALAVRDDVRRHARAVRAVFGVDVLDHLLALVAR